VPGRPQRRYRLPLEQCIRFRQGRETTVNQKPKRGYAAEPWDFIALRVDETRCSEEHSDKLEGRQHSGEGDGKRVCETSGLGKLSSVAEGAKRVDGGKLSVVAEGHKRRWVLGPCLVVGTISRR